MPSRSVALEGQGSWKWSRITGAIRSDVSTRLSLLGAVYVLHAFQKKSKAGIKTPKQDIELVRERLKRAEEHYRQWVEKQRKQTP